MADKDNMADEDEELSPTLATAFEIIAAVGSAKSKYVEAINKARDNDFEGARALVEDGTKDFNEGHSAHLTMLQQSVVDPDSVTFSLLLVHSEDQLMMAEQFRILAGDFIDVYEKMAALK